MSKPLKERLIVIPFLLVTGLVHAQSAREERPVGAFSRLTVQHGIDVYLTQSAQQSLRLEAVGYDLEDVITEVEGDELRLYREGPWRDQLFGDHQVRAYVGFVQLSALQASSGSDIQSENDLRLERLSVEASGGSDVDLAVEAQSLEFRLSGGSDLRLRGSTQSLAIEASGGSDTAARSLDAEQVKLSVSGGSDAIVRATAGIEIDAHGGSDVSVHGSPARRTVNNDRSSDIEWR